MSKELISIIIPVHNSALYLHHCLKSVLNQTYKNLEIILVENGSTDNSYQLCQEYAAQDCRITVIKLEAANVSIARNEGIKCAHGKYVMFADSDDYCDSGWCETLWKLEIESSGKYIPVCGMSMVFDYKKTNSTLKLYNYKEKESIIEKKEFLLLYNKWLVNYLWNKLYVREDLLKYEIFMPEDMNLGEDLIFNLRYCDIPEKKGFVVGNVSLYYYVKNQKESLTNQYRRELFDIQHNINSQVYRYCVKWGVRDFSLLDDIVHYQYQSMISQAFDKQNDMAFHEKIRYINRILSTEEFQRAIVYQKKNLERCVFWAYRKKSYILLQFIIFLEKIKHIIQKPVYLIKKKKKENTNYAKQYRTGKNHNNQSTK